MAYRDCDYIHSFYFIGKVTSSDVWDDFIVTDINDVDTYCEYFQSQWVTDGQVRYRGVYKRVGWGLAVEV